MRIAGLLTVLLGSLLLPAAGNHAQSQNRRGEANLAGFRKRDVSRILRIVSWAGWKRQRPCCLCAKKATCRLDFVVSTEWR